MKSSPFVRIHRNNLCTALVAGFLLGSGSVLALLYFTPAPPPTVNIWREVEPKVEFRDNADLPLPEPLQQADPDEGLLSV